MWERKFTPQKVSTQVFHTVSVFKLLILLENMKLLQNTNTFDVFNLAKSMQKLLPKRRSDKKGRTFQDLNSMPCRRPNQFDKAIQSTRQLSVD